MASTELRHRVEKVVAYPPLSELSDLQRRDFHEALLEAVSFEDLPGGGRRRSWQWNRTGRGTSRQWRLMLDTAGCVHPIRRSSDHSSGFGARACRNLD